jgi:hypothetical protein
MNFTFGIITTKQNPELELESIINSIKDLSIPNYEIIIIGGNISKESENLQIFAFQESASGAWITKKKNLITEKAKYENVVYMHDYILFDKDWYSNFIKFGNDFNLCMNQILNEDGRRYRDWTLWAESADQIGVQNPYYLLPYEIKYLSKLMYFSGAYWVAKRDVMKEFPLNENLFWGQGEDVEWSKRIREKYNFSINKDSIVKLNRYKDPAFLACNRLDHINQLDASRKFHNL